MSTETAASPPTPGASADRRRALVFEGDEKIRAATCEVLRREKYEVFPSKSIDDIVQLAKELVPSILMVDIELPDIDLRKILRTLSRFRETRPVKAVLLCPPEFDEVRCNSLKSLGAFGILHRPLKRAAIVEMAATAQKASDEERAKLDASTARRPSLAKLVESNNSLLSRQVVCPFHEDPVPFTRYTLRTGKIATETNFFDLTVYKSAPKSVDFCNYHLCAAIVCPRCWFTSIHAAYFIDPLDPNAKAHIFNAPTWEAVRADAVIRRQVAADLPGDFYTERRTLPQAIISYELAIACSKILYEKNRRSLPIELVRIGNYHLRIAHLKELSAASPNVIDSHYRDAMNVLQEAFTVADGPQVFKIAYQMAALKIYFGDDKVARQYLDVMLRSKRDKVIPEDQADGLARYLPRCQSAWVDRDLHRSPLLLASQAA